MQVTPHNASVSFGKLAEQLAPRALELVADLIDNALNDDDPSAYIERRLQADGAHAASQLAVDAVLKR